jgi:hypothetical protein
MKYISLIAVVLFIAFTAWFSKRTEDLTIDQMNKMNNLITQYMTQAVQNNNPNISDIDFSKIYTEVIEKGRKMKAHFSFSYMEPNSDGEMEKVYRKGTFLIASEDGQKWTAQIEKAGDVKVEFLEPFEITDEGVEPLSNTASDNESSKPEVEESMLEPGSDESDEMESGDIDSAEDAE